MRFLNFFIVFLFLLIHTTSTAQSPVALFTEVQNDSFIVHMRNKVDCPFYVVLEPEKAFPEEGQFAAPFILRPRDSMACIYSFPITSSEDTTDLDLLALFQYNITYGDPKKVEADEDFQYTLPFPIGKKYQIIQGFNGRKSHNYPRSRYAIDFNMEIGDTICAARGGIVVGVRENYDKGGNSRKFQPYSNKVVIYHSDGTFSHYAHLKQNGALVDLGQRVEQGQPIALSGNTGYSSGPHLHFVVRIPTKEGEVSIPIRFEGVKSRKLRKSHKMVKRKK